MAHPFMSHPVSTPVTPPRLHAFIPCAGSGSRAGAGAPKQYRPVAGLAVVRHTLAAFAAVPRVATVMVGVAPGDRELAQEPGIVLAECGGPTRAATVLGGLQALRERGAGEDDWVLVHDAARCLVTPELIERLIAGCEGDPVGGLLAQPLADTLKQGLAGRAEATVPREGLWLAQTPQMFRLGLLASALAQAGDGVTDEASAIEQAGHRPRLVPGSAHNFKLTWPEDFALAEALLRTRQETRA
ncbi:2-C-methyl-D-erythritol 4-phosphate cytidylyltransferase [Ramlibacter rhizophilus]|uniref:2-C-methyl-D-erythritol 4-phosphate cytidylyltransferase n=1 Tax=Ramlibacter rhizophilus TaxID=1781167 RepID=A0A4Z0BD72_9BURK|nr:2-C-methyl-D-erythritol 4-phosphate cytidylyltransferase [Ramlibacter rhizophilus]TFY96730.1 2-C-methyl-D-erythritol 4-phosphate cytidylyltransferase [Ramlibacter rhizophilus]